MRVVFPPLIDVEGDLRDVTETASGATLHVAIKKKVATIDLSDADAAVLMAKLRAVGRTHATEYATSVSTSGSVNPLFIPRITLPKK